MDRSPSFSREALDIARLSSTTAENSAAVQLYQQLLQDRGTLAGSSFALIVLAAGAFSEIRNLQYLEASIVTLAIGAIILALCALYFAGRKGQEAHTLAAQALTER